VSHFQVKIFRYYKIEATGYRNTTRLIENIFDIVQKKQETKARKVPMLVSELQLRVLSRYAACIFSESVKS